MHAVDVCITVIYRHLQIVYNDDMQAVLVA